MIYSTARNVSANPEAIREYEKTSNEIKRCIRELENISINGYNYKPYREQRRQHLKDKINTLFDLQIKIRDEAKCKCKILVPYRLLVKYS